MSKLCITTGRISRTVSRGEIEGFPKRSEQDVAVEERYNSEEGVFNKRYISQEELDAFHAEYNQTREEKIYI